MTDLAVNQTLNEYWNIQSIETIAFLQNKLFDYEWWIVQASVYGDNREAFTFFFPIIAGLWSILGAKALWAAILVEWSNLILKWLFKGDRPYWWLPESDAYDAESRPLLRQFPNTCESGPGTPSGHIMMNVALFYVITRGLISHFIWHPRRNICLRLLLSSIAIAAYIAWIALIFISRLYIQAHFIHQCVFGVVMGLLIGHIAWASKWLVQSHRFSSIVFANILIGSSLITFMVMLNHGLDPLWSIPLALKHCSNPDFVKIDTQPYFIMTRFTAAALGLGFGLASNKFMSEEKAPGSMVRTALKIKSGILLGRVATLVQSKIPTNDLIVYLISSFSVHLVFPYVIMALLPYFILSLYSPK